ncbi:cytochrome P450 76T24-like [Prosopis cineraria]|uniref:cytochrome P450 76T24-like n=1 Tax=Prosopis cineraria TaxID=364024 RepID=UPI00240EFF3D|nr:cytochrome P450 76T24-like [Prosopis cineraria]
MDNLLVLILTSFLCASFLIYILFIKRASNKSLKLKDDNSSASIHKYSTCFVRSSSSSSYRLPPGPRAYPVIGNILELGSNPLLSITNLSKSHGPIMSLKLGTRIAIVISSPEIAKEAFQKHDLDFSSRTFPDCARALDRHRLSVTWLAVSPQWRTLRRVCVTKVFSTLKLDTTQFLRQSKVGDLIHHVHEYSIKGEAIDLTEALFTTVLKSISNMLFSMDFARYGSDKAREYKKLMIGIVDEAGRVNVSDLFYVLSFLDLQGVRARMTGYLRKLYKIFDDIMEDRLRFRSLNKESKDYTDVLDSFLNLMQDGTSQLSRDDALHLFIDLFIAGVDTTSSTLEWAMAELMRNPEKMIKARTELQQVLSKSTLKFEESMVSKLPFLQATLKETLRLHPPAPFLVPHKAICDVELCGFLVPRNSQILANVWAMGRDPSIWENPKSFIPERFLESELDFKGNDFNFIPFGAGRRMCPGLPLASRVLSYMLASLIYHFDWKVPDGLKAEDMDMSQRYGLTMHKTQPLRAIPVRV